MRVGADRKRVAAAGVRHDEQHAWLVERGEARARRQGHAFVALEQSRAWTRDARDPLWAADRPADWDAARERLGQLHAVGDSRRGFEAPSPFQRFSYDCV